MWLIRYKICVNIAWNYKDQLVRCIVYVCFSLLNNRVNTLDIQLTLAYPFASSLSQISNRIHKCWLLNLCCQYSHLLNMNYFDILVVCRTSFLCYRISWYNGLPKQFTNGYLVNSVTTYLPCQHIKHERKSGGFAGS